MQFHFKLISYDKTNKMKMIFCLYEYISAVLLIRLRLQVELRLRLLTSHTSSGV